MDEENVNPWKIKIENMQKGIAIDEHMSEELVEDDKKQVVLTSGNTVDYSDEKSALIATTKEEPEKVSESSEKAVVTDKKSIIKCSADEKDAENKLKTESDSFQCDVCKETIESMKSAAAHFKGKSHRRKMELLFMEKCVKKDKCELCGTTLQSLVQVFDHYNGFDHAANLIASKPHRASRTNVMIPMIIGGSSRGRGSLGGRGGFKGQNNNFRGQSGSGIRGHSGGGIRGHSGGGIRGHSGGGIRGHSGGGIRGHSGGGIRGQIGGSIRGRGALGGTPGISRPGDLDVSSSWGSNDTGSNTNHNQRGNRTGRGGGRGNGFRGGSHARGGGRGGQSNNGFSDASWSNSNEQMSSNGQNRGGGKMLTQNWQQSRPAPYGGRSNQDNFNRGAQNKIGSTRGRGGQQQLTSGWGGNQFDNVDNSVVWCDVCELSVSSSRLDVHYSSLQHRQKQSSKKAAFGNQMTSQNLSTYNYGTQRGISTNQGQSIKPGGGNQLNAISGSMPHHNSGSETFSSYGTATGLDFTASSFNFANGAQLW